MSQFASNLPIQCRRLKLLRGCPPFTPDDCGGWISFAGGVISEPGRYCLNRNLETTATRPIAITINSSDVVLDMNTKTLTLRNEAGDIGVQVNDVVKVEIYNGRI